MRKKKKKSVVKDLFGDIMEEEALLMDDDERQSQAEQTAIQEEYEAELAARLYGKKPEKAYTLTIISDPEQSGVEAAFKDYKRWLVD